MSNHLASETSPYLLQHTDNPVDWRPWGPEALESARAQDKPILLSIGYSACHWCHVMAHESFEDEATAALMNELYVNIKVDREERPDIDRIYQTAQQLYTGRAGGWPLTAFLTPDDHVPIFIGTYFPRRAAYGMPAFRDVLTRVESYYRTHRDEIRNNGRALDEAFRKLDAQPAEPAERLTLDPLVAAVQRLADAYDNRNGGFGGAPKFPHATGLALLLDAGCTATDRTAPEGTALKMLRHSLTQMARRGLYDHLGGGFFRYSVDGAWTIPHFEKMLYDNAALLDLYADAYGALAEPSYARVAAETAQWVLREMRGPDGAFFSTLDADSEGREGKFYVWTAEQARSVLEPEQQAVAERCFGLNGPANFEGDFWHLQLMRGVDDVADELHIAPQRAEASLDEAKRRLFDARSHRVRPGRDEKCLTSWNGLMIGAFAKAARRLDSTDLADAAAAAVDFIAERLWQGGRLRAVYKDGRARFDAYLDDYAFLAAGLLELLQCRWRTADFEFAVQLADALLTHFEDRERGGFFFTADDHEPLIHRPKPLADESVPSGNGIAARVLSDLGHLLGETRYLDAAERTVRSALPAIERSPEAHATLLEALARQIEPPELIIVRGKARDLGAWCKVVTESGYRPARLSFSIPDDAQDLPGLLAERRAGAEPVAYVCRGTECRAPIHDLTEFERTLRATS
jgi:uncharacterized protein YyaL (SSP411 family)